MPKAGQVRDDAPGPAEQRPRAGQATAGGGGKGGGGGVRVSQHELAQSPTGAVSCSPCYVL